MRFHNPIMVENQARQPVKAPENLVFSGGGIKGLAYAGAICALEEKGLFKSVTRVAGASAGAITASLLAIGMNGSDIKREMEKVDFATFLQKSNVNIQEIADNPKKILDPIIGFKVIYDEAEHKGLCDASVFTQWLTSMFKKKGFDEKTTFKTLHKDTKKELSVAVCNINYGKTIIANYTNTPDMPVVSAVRASMSMPFIYQPFEWNGDLYVDGGTMYNYPIEVFDEECPPEKTLGFILSTEDSILNPKRRTDNGIVEHIECFFDAVMNVSYEYCFRLGNQYRTVFIDPAGVGTLDFKLTDEQKTKLVDNGHTATINYFK
ncbi:MAG TPA: patatin-like phospholipase family protein [Clostridia bacterium]|nr:patatin-like phospholipase family protein [Clostridia bacterium]